MTFIDCGQRPSQATDTQGFSTKHVAVALTLLGAGLSLTAVGLGKLNGRVGLPLAGAFGITALAVGFWPAKTSTAPSTPSRDPDANPEPVTSLKITEDLTHEELLAELKRHPELKELDLRDWHRVMFGPLEAYFYEEGPLEIVHYTEFDLDKALRDRIVNDTTTEADKRFLSRIADYNDDWVKEFGVNQEKLLALLPNLRRASLSCYETPDEAALAAFEAFQPIVEELEEVKWSGILLVVRKHILNADPDALAEPYRQWLESLEELAVGAWNYANDEQPIDLAPLIQRCPNLRTINLKFLDKEQWTDTLAEEVKKLPHLERVLLPYDVQREIVDLIKAGTPLENHQVIALEYIKDREVNNAKPDEAIRLLEKLPRLKELGLCGWYPPTEEQAQKLLDLLDKHPSVEFTYSYGQKVLEEEPDGPLVDLAIRGLELLSLEHSDNLQRLAQRLQRAQRLTRIHYSPGEPTDVLDHMAVMPQGKKLQIGLNDKSLEPQVMASLLSKLQPKEITFRSGFGESEMAPSSAIVDQLQRNGYRVLAVKDRTPPCPPSETSSDEVKAVTWDTFRANPALLSESIDDYYFIFAK